MANPKTRHDHLQEADSRELIEELKRRRLERLRDCSDKEIEEELAKRPDYDPPPKLVEK